jgi:hypothetical protein
MLHNSRSRPETPETDEPGAPDSKLAQLERQERLWFSWLAVLNERLMTAKPGDAILTEGQKILEVAKRRWAEARDALRQHRTRG